jgi:glycosidase
MKYFCFKHANGNTSGMKHLRPEWFRKAVIYQILIDRFSGAKASSNKPVFLGGNIKGITKRLDYLAGLGVNTIWLSPFWSTNEYHGYHILDYENVDTHFGSPDDLKHLINEAHAKSLRVITDFVPNHCSARHPFFLEASRNRNSRYYNWFYFKKWPDEYLCFLDVKDLAKLNLDNPDTRDYMIGVAKYWLSIGIDGYRIDHVIGPSHNFWKQFSKELKSSYPDCVLFGEAWGEGISRKYFNTINIKNKFLCRIFGVSQENIQKEYYGKLDGVLDFSLNKIITNAAAGGEGFTSGSEFRKKVTDHFSKYPEDYYLILFLDNHDMNRFLFYCNGNYNLLLEALEFILGTTYPVVIYYGTETGMINKIPVNVSSPYSDLSVRELFRWTRVKNGHYVKMKALLQKYRGLPD